MHVVPSIGTFLLVVDTSTHLIGSVHCTSIIEEFFENSVWVLCDIFLFFIPVLIMETGFGTSTCSALHDPTSQLADDVQSGIFVCFAQCMRL